MPIYSQSGGGAQGEPGESARMTHVFKAANYTASPGEFVEADTTAGAFAVAIPDPATCAADDKITVKLVAGSGAVTVTGAIDGAANHQLTIINECYDYVVDSTLTKWLIR